MRISLVSASLGAIFDIIPIFFSIFFAMKKAVYRLDRFSPAAAVSCGPYFDPQT
jgi:hypothetical protein